MQATNTTETFLNDTGDNSIGLIIAIIVLVVIAVGIVAAVVINRNKKD
jgi:hypothetical protein